MNGSQLGLLKVRGWVLKRLLGNYENNEIFYYFLKNKRRQDIQERM